MLSAVSTMSAGPASAAPGVPDAPGVSSVSPGSVGPGSVGAPPPVRPEDRGGDHLTVTVRHAGAGKDGTYELYCHPGGGSHPDVRRACRVLDGRTRWGRDTFAPVQEGSVCTLQYGGPATAHITGTWAGRPVDARYDRRDGCAISRWDGLVPVLPGLGR
ncbi:hypothetical protein A8713_15240 [Streptomyces sp. SAT1]|nr:hypothetical protein A8713_15240 [Streptomyces sp. SAT1]